MLPVERHDPNDHPPWRTATRPFDGIVVEFASEDLAGRDRGVLAEQLTESAARSRRPRHRCSPCSRLTSADSPSLPPVRRRVLCRRRTFQGTRELELKSPRPDVRGGRDQIKVEVAAADFPDARTDARDRAESAAAARSSDRPLNVPRRTAPPAQSRCKCQGHTAPAGA